MKTFATSPLPIRRKAEGELSTDIGVLRENHPDLYAQLREVVCEPEGTSASSGGERTSASMQ